MNFIKGNGGVLVIVGVVAALLAGYNEWRISVAVTAQFEAASLVNPASVEANTESINDLEKADERMDSKIERIVDILLED